MDNPDEVHQDSDNQADEAQQASPQAQQCKKCGANLANSSDPACSECGEPIEAAAENRGPCALLVEDAPLDQAKFSALLQQLGCHVEAVQDGVSAIKKLEGFEPDLIIVDLHMPRKGGIETLKEIRHDNRFLKTPIIVLTGKNDPLMVRAALRSGPTDYLLKSNDPEHIKERFRKHLNL